MKSEKRTTTVVIIGESTTKQAPRPITFSLDITSVDSAPNDICADPSDWNYIELIARNYCDGYDLMFAYDHPSLRGEGIAYLGHFNDGIVE